MFHWFFIEGLHLHNVLTIDVFPSSHASIHRQVDEKAFYFTNSFYVQKFVEVQTLCKK